MTILVVAAALVAGIGYDRNYLVSFVFLIVAVVFAFAFKPGGVTSN